MGLVGSSGQTLNSISIFKSIICKISCKHQYMKTSFSAHINLNFIFKLDFPKCQTVFIKASHRNTLKLLPTKYLPTFQRMQDLFASHIKICSLYSGDLLLTVGPFSG